MNQITAQRDGGEIQFRCALLIHIKIPPVRLESASAGSHIKWKKGKYVQKLAPTFLREKLLT